MQIGAEMALRHIGLRIGLTGDGWIERHDKASRAMIPGGFVLEFSKEGEASLLGPNGRSAGRGPINNPRFFASLMHNCDAMAAEEYGPGTLEAILLADAIIDTGKQYAETAIVSTVRGPDGRGSALSSDCAAMFHPSVMALADVSEPALRQAYMAWRAARIDSRHATPWNDVDSLVRWNGRIAAMLRRSEPIPSENGCWELIEEGCGLVEAARSLGMPEGRLNATSSFYERSLYTLRLSGGGTVPKPNPIVAVAVFENGELASVARHVDPQKRPDMRTSKDLISVIRHVEELEHRHEPETSFSI